MSYANVPILPGYRAVRARPAMYIGSTDVRGLHELLDEVLAVVLESALRGFTRRIDLTIHPDGSAELGCDGPGFLTGSDHLGQRGLAFAFDGSIHNSGIPPEWGNGSLGGWSGGLIVFSALSAYLDVTSRLGGAIERACFEGGARVDPREPPSPVSEEYGTYLRWLPDPEIFHTTTWDFERLDSRLRTLACLVAGLEIRLADLRTGERRQYYYPDGVADLVQLLGTGREVLHAPVRLELQAEWGEASVALQYHLASHGCNPVPGEVVTFANHRNTREGVHLTAFKTALVDVVQRAVREYAPLPPGKGALRWKDVRSCLRAVVAVRLNRLLWEGCTRCRVGDLDQAGPLTQAFTEGLEQSRQEQPDVWRAIARQVASCAPARPQRERSVRVIARNR